MALTRRQKQILDFIKEFIEKNGYSPSLEEIGRHFNLSSVATVHKHVTNLVRKGLLRRTWNQNRSLEVVSDDEAPRAVVIPLVGRIPPGRPVEAVEFPEQVEVPAWLMGRGHTYALLVVGDAMIDEHVLDGDWVIIEERRHAESGQLVVTVVHGEDATIRRLYREGETVRLVPPNRAFETTVLPADRVEVRGVVRGVIRRMAV